MCSVDLRFSQLINPCMHLQRSLQQSLASLRFWSNVDRGVKVYNRSWTAAILGSQSQQMVSPVAALRVPVECNLSRWKLQILQAATGFPSKLYLNAIPPIYESLNNWGLRDDSPKWTRTAWSMEHQSHGCLLMGPMQAKSAWTSSVFWKSPVSWSWCSDKPVLSWDPFNHIVWRPGRPSQHLSALRRPGTRTGLNSCIIWKMVKLWMQSDFGCHFTYTTFAICCNSSVSFFCAVSIYIIIHRCFLRRMTSKTSRCQCWKPWTRCVRWSAASCRCQPWGSTDRWRRNWSERSSCLIGCIDSWNRTRYPESMVDNPWDMLRCWNLPRERSLPSTEVLKSQNSGKDV